MNDAEQTAFTFLSFANERDDAEGVLGKTWAVERAAALAYARQIADVVDIVGQDYIGQAGAPAWIAVAAHRSGIALPETVRLYNELRTRLSEQMPMSIVEWAQLMIAILGVLQPQELLRLLPKNSYGESSRLSGIYSTDSAMRSNAWAAYEHALAAWMTGKPLIEVAAEIHARDVNGNAGRGGASF